ncbi:MAG: hypothetical protein ACXWXA_07575 [Candidatus Limnocylindrales bacterium]
MGFLRRLLGGGGHPDATNAPDAAIDPADAEADVDADEQAYELELLRGEQARLDELAQRQLRYAKYAWQPPAQGGERRADDRDARR